MINGKGTISASFVLDRRGQGMAQGCDEAPLHRKQVPIKKLRRGLIGSRHAKGKLECAKQRFLNLVFRPGAESHMDFWAYAMKAADGVDQHVGNQVLAGHDL